MLVYNKNVGKTKKATSLKDIAKFYDINPTRIVKVIRGNMYFREKSDVKIPPSAAAGAPEKRKAEEVPEKEMKKPRRVTTTLLPKEEPQDD